MIRFALATLVASATLPVVVALAQTTAPPKVTLTAPAREPRAAPALTIANGRAVTAVTLTVTAEAETVKHAGPLASNANVSMPLPKMRGCLVTVAATFQDGSVSNGGDTDVCKVKLVRLID
jgi:hypothetical protein